jgi:dihydrofolate synthase / folylpolyglutamate synthase
VVDLQGRFQVLPGRPTIVLDVAHNPQAARALATTLASMGRFPQTIAVFGILADKDIGGVIAAMKEQVDRWYVATLHGPRGAGAVAVATALANAGVAANATLTFDDVGSAVAAARAAASEADRIIVFGSFLTVAAALAVAR